MDNMDWLSGIDWEEDNSMENPPDDIDAMMASVSISVNLKRLAQLSAETDLIHKAMDDLQGTFGYTAPYVHPDYVEHIDRAEQYKSIEYTIDLALDSVLTEYNEVLYMVGEVLGNLELEETEQIIELVQSFIEKKRP